MALDVASFQAALKQHYGSDRVQDMTYKDHPLLAMLAKKEDFGGDVWKLPIITANPQGASVDFTVAQANKTDVQTKAFLIQRSKFYSLASIGNEVMEASKGNANAFLEAATTQIDGAIETAARQLAIAVYGSGSGSIGRVANSSFATPVLQLTQPEEITNFEVGQTLVLSATDGTGTVKVGTMQIVGADRDAGTLTFAANLSALVPTIAQNDYIFVQGNYGQMLKGLRAWVPDTAPTSTPFFGVDRSVDATRLGGIRFDGSAMPIEEALISAASRAAREGAKPSHCFMNYLEYADLEKALGSKVQYVNMPVKAEIAFRGILVNGPRGPINVVPDQDCPPGRAFMLDLSTWKLASIGKAPKLLDSDGLKMLRESNADAVEVRIGYYAQLACNAPGRNVNIKLR